MLKSSNQVLTKAAFDVILRVSEMEKSMTNSTQFKITEHQIKDYLKWNKIVNKIQTKYSIQDYSKYESTFGDDSITFDEEQTQQDAYIYEFEDEDPDHDYSIDFEKVTINKDHYFVCWTYGNDVESIEEAIPSVFNSIDDAEAYCSHPHDSICIYSEYVNGKAVKTVFNYQYDEFTIDGSIDDFLGLYVAVINSENDESLYIIDETNVEEDVTLEVEDFYYVVKLLNKTNKLYAVNISENQTVFLHDIADVFVLFNQVEFMYGMKLKKEFGMLKDGITITVEIHGKYSFYSIKAKVKNFFSKLFFKKETLVTPEVFLKS
jgi:hypothetical protein